MPPSTTCSRGMTCRNSSQSCSWVGTQVGVAVGMSAGRQLWIGWGGVSGWAGLSHSGLQGIHFRFMRDMQQVKHALQVGRQDIRHAA